MSLSGVPQSYVCYLAITVFFTHRKKANFMPLVVIWTTSNTNKNCIVLFFLISSVSKYYFYLIEQLWSVFNQANCFSLDSESVVACNRPQVSSKKKCEVIPFKQV